MKKKREEIPTFTILNPNFQDVINGTDNSAETEKTEEKIDSRSENYED